MQRHLWSYKTVVEEAPGLCGGFLFYTYMLCESYLCGKIEVDGESNEKDRILFGHVRGPGKFDRLYAVAGTEKGRTGRTD